MADANAEETGSRNSFVRALAGFRASLLRAEPAQLLVLGYGAYMIVGWAILAMPFASEQAVEAVDHLFIAVSAVSTTGLVTVDPGTTYSFWGELTILLLIQAGAVGYMTIGSFTILITQHKLSRLREKVTKAAFSLPDGYRPTTFLRTVIIFTLICEAAGVAALYPMFFQADVENALWSAIFHSISAFCTAGFSLNSNSFVDFRDHVGINAVLSILSLLGAVGFLIVVDAWRNLTSGKTHLGFTSKVILRLTVLFLVFGTVLLLITEPSLRALGPTERVTAAFFQTMTASTTVGFNTHPIGAMGLSSLVVLFVLMAIGASPAGTGGGLKTTTFAAMAGLVRSTLKQRKHVTFAGRRIPLRRLQSATATTAFFFTLLVLAVFFLGLTEAGASLDVILFEAVSALGTVGLSMGLTGELSDLGKLVIIVLMIAGRVGILTFGIALAVHAESEEELEDNDLVC
ncbi:potassium transporter KtrB [Parvularcula sp. ZS-1/3]|uniref:Potassium transporter KtrB n=1 Tax=Parvularcula mediterranea TaxID=2732508 RepID=A0A7Y3RK91_9PROT|nr:potassium transporter TrkG [Parvularcula mediterranea]NNU15571.1 potassium transporter KtrB [Parvularcula mediterranea]